MDAATAIAGVAKRTIAGRDFRLLWTGQSISKTGSAVTTFALPLVAVRTLGAGPLMMGVLGAMIWLPWLLVGLHAGAWADRRTKRPLMIASQIVSAILIVSIPVLAWLNMLTMWYVLLIAFAAGSSNVVFTAAYSAFVPFLAGRDELLGANMRLTGSEQVANIAGPGIGGLIAQFSSAVLGLFIDAASFLVCAGCLLGIRAREPSDRRPEGPRPGFLADIRVALGFLVRDPYLRVLTGASASANLLLSGIQALVVVFLIRTAGLSSWAVAATTITISVGGVLGAFVAPRISRRLGSARALLVSTPVTDAFLLLFPLARHGALLVLALAGVLPWATGIVMRNVLVGSFRQAYCPPGMLARVSMSTRFVLFGVWPFGSLLGGLLGTVVGVRPALFILADVNFLANIWLFIGPMKNSRDLPATAEAHEGIVTSTSTSTTATTVIAANGNVPPGEAARRNAEAHAATASAQAAESAAAAWEAADTAEAASAADRTHALAAEERAQGLEQQVSSLSGQLTAALTQAGTAEREAARAAAAAEAAARELTALRATADAARALADAARALADDATTRAERAEAALDAEHATRLGRYPS